MNSKTGHVDGFGIFGSTSFQQQDYLSSMVGMADT